MSPQDTYGAKILRTESERKGVSLRSFGSCLARLVGSWCGAAASAAGRLPAASAQVARSGVIKDTRQDTLENPAQSWCTVR